MPRTTHAVCISIGTRVVCVGHPPLGSSSAQSTQVKPMSEHAVTEQPGAGVAESAGAIASASTGLASALLTVVAGACCVSPVLAPIFVSVLGASGAVWAAGLKPYGWWILGGSAALLALGF